MRRPNDLAFVAFCCAAACVAQQIGTNAVPGGDNTYKLTAIPSWWSKRSW